MLGLNGIARDSPAHKLRWSRLVPGDGSAAADDCVRRVKAAVDHVPGFAVAAVSKVYVWASLGNAHIVNIGGSRGQVAIELAKNFGNIKLLVQEAAMAIKGADKDVPEQLKERV
ncbi:hypothetical protein H633G_01136 [Metarhizium anisopliae BRIP 53284]|nr:hypothetical protein H633G_01136 [Metarhizium anisopliae BRIP 53284]